MGIAVREAPFVIYFGEPMALQRELTGGKGASLGLLVQAGLPVPLGFIVPSSVYSAFYETGMTARASGEIINAFDQLGLGLVAVRSSATVEDSSEASWAGQFESYLGIDRDHLMETIWRCWESASSALVEAYAREHLATREPIALAVVVQEMIDCEIAGVMFTKNPVTNDDKQIIIEACYGLGEFLAQGLVTPDNYIVQKEGLRISSITVSGQNRQMRLVRGRVEEIGVDIHRRWQRKLTEEDISSLSNLALRIEALCSIPQDVEWGIHNGKLYALQARPVTT